MDEEDDMDIAAAMGFSSFGGTKKRKYDQTGSPKAPTEADASGANTTELGVRTNKNNNEELELDNEDVDMETATAPSVSTHQAKNMKKPPAATGLADFLARAQTLPDKPPATQGVQSAHTDARRSGADEMVSFGGPSISKAELNALRFGVKTDHGDNAYFLPDFVGDPWEKLTSGK
jgi:hypothetical protein